MAGEEAASEVVEGEAAEGWVAVRAKAAEVVFQAVGMAAATAAALRVARTAAEPGPHTGVGSCCRPGGNDTRGC